MPVHSSFVHWVHLPGVVFPVVTDWFQSDQLLKSAEYKEDVQAINLSFYVIPLILGQVQIGQFFVVLIPLWFVVLQKSKFFESSDIYIYIYSLSIVFLPKQIGLRNEYQNIVGLGNCGKVTCHTITVADNQSPPII